MIRRFAAIAFALRGMAFLACILSLAAPAALAQSQADLNISTPAVTALRESLGQRYREHLRPYFASGAIGLTRDGLIALRDANAVPLAQRQQLNAQIAAENQERAALYREIARANNHPEWESEIRSTFAKRWVERAPAGWYYQDSNGIWVRK